MAIFFSNLFNRGASHSDHTQLAGPAIKQAVAPAVAAADQRIKDRGLAEFKKIIDRMAEDPSYAPDPIDLVEAGVPEKGSDFDAVDFTTTYERHS